MTAYLYVENNHDSRNSLVMDVMCFCHPCLSGPRKTSESMSHGVSGRAMSRRRSCRSHTIITLPLNILHLTVLHLVCEPNHHATKIHKGRGGNKPETTERKLLATTVRARFNDPSAVSTSKQHWPIEMCRSGALPVECSWLYLHALTFGPEMKI